ncbi:MAG: FAD-dependent oxidoreductase [Clostridia bacterium]|nr:FAD-dependent oxidoreductase [Clostridia bacterium]
MPEVIVGGQTLADTVSGASITANAIIRATEDALRQAGADDAQIALLKSTVPAVEVPQNNETDILVIGAGAAGMGAAITAADEGASVILLEKLDITGGTARLSGGCIWGPGSKAYTDMQAVFPDVQLSFTPEDIMEHIAGYCGVVRNEALFLNLAKNSPYMLDYAVENGHELMQYLTNSNQVARPEWRTIVPKYAGAGVAQTLTKMVGERAIDLRLATEATRLLTDESGAVIGAEAVVGGQTYEIKAKKVILATGGFTFNKEMMAQYCEGDYENSVDIASVGNTGDGHRMGVEVGGYIVGEGALGITCIGYNPSTNATLWNPFLHVNVKGEKIMRSDQYYPKVQEIINDQEKGEVYTIYGSDSYNVDTLEGLVARGLLKKADTIDELAAALGIDAEGLKATLDVHNKCAAEGTTDEFGSAPASIKPVTQGPFYGCRRSACVMGTIPGLAVDENLKVLREDGTAIENLYAAGEVMFGNVMDDLYPMTGTALALAWTGGRLAVLDALQ